VKTFNQLLREIYDEPDDSSVTDSGHVYDLNRLLSATLGMPTQQFQVNELVWIFKWDDPAKDPGRENAADLNAPILVTKEGNRLVVLDGLHRLGKAAEQHQATIKGILVNPEILARYRLR
jgi:hypothetical protein